jgi:DnaJ like chaperone protein
MSLWTRLTQHAPEAFAPPGEIACADPDRACGPDTDDVDFTAAVIGLGAKMAKADGAVTVEEVKAFSRVFRTAPEDEIAVRRVYDMARQTVRGFDSYARRLGKRYGDRPCLLEGVLDGLFQIALADGALTSEEADYLRQVSEAFGFEAAEFRRIMASHMGPEPDDPYAVLGVSPQAEFEDIRSAYRRLMRENHPDTVRGARGAPRAFELTAHEKAAAITSAYAKIRVERGFVTRSD